MENKVNISKNILNIIDTFVKKDREANYYGTDTKLHFSEIHMIVFIKENKGLHMSRIAEEMNVTRGAVSQTIGRLYKKGFLVKEISDDNKSKLEIKLTEKGEIAYNNHQKEKKDFYSLVSHLLKDYDEEKIESLDQFLENLNNEI